MRYHPGLRQLWDSLIQEDLLFNLFTSFIIIWYCEGNHKQHLVFQSIMFPKSCWHLQSLKISNQALSEKHRQTDILTFVDVWGIFEEWLLMSYPNSTQEEWRLHFLLPVTVLFRVVLLWHYKNHFRLSFHKEWGFWKLLLGLVFNVFLRLWSGCEFSQVSGHI